MHHFCCLALFPSIMHHNGIMPTAVEPIKRSSVSPRTNSAGQCAEKKPDVCRTTVALSPESLEIVERFKSACGVSTSAAIDQIIQRSEPKPSRLKEVNGFLVLDVPVDPKTAHFTLEDVKRIEDEMDREYVERSMHPQKNSASSRIRAEGRQ
jgi:hypothetical protein